MSFMIKEEKFFMKYIEFWEKISNIIEKEFNSKLLYNKRYINAEKTFNAKESFQCFVCL